MALPATSLTERDGPSAGSFAARWDAQRRASTLHASTLHASIPHASTAEVSAALAGTFKTAAELQSVLELRGAERVLSLGIPALDALLPEGGMPLGSVVELQVRGASGAATSFALCSCRAAQQAGERWQHGQAAASLRPWCAFIDPGGSLFAPGVARLGVDLARLLVVRPEPDAVERVAVRIAEAKAVALLVIDLRGALGERSVSSQRWQRTVRRLALVVKQLTTTIVLITPSERQALPLPVAMRLEFARAAAESFEVRIGKERSGRVSSARTIPWSAFEPVLH